MPTNAILGYLDLISRTKYRANSPFFQNRTTLTSPRLPAIAPVAQGLPIHTLLGDIEKHVKEIEKHEQQDPSRSDAALRDAAKFFEPLMLHHWQLVRLLNVLRCHTSIFQLAAKDRDYAKKVEALRLKIFNTQDAFFLEEMNADLVILEQKHAEARRQYETAHADMLNNEETKANIQAALVLSTLLNVIFRKGMSAPMLSDELNLEAQQKEYRDLLRDCRIVFDTGAAEDEANRIESFPAIFTQHPSLLSKEAIPNDPLSSAKYVISLVLGTQRFHTRNNHWRLGSTRLRREGAFLIPYLQNDTYSSVFNTFDPYIRRGLAYVNWMFFIPRLTLNCSLLYHHLLNERELNPLERTFTQWTRFRTHWTRFWFEMIADMYWILNGLIICFVLNGGVLSGPGLYLSMTVQALDLFISIIRACIELYRLYSMKCDLKALNPNFDMDGDMWGRLRFEAFALGYNVFHFSLLMLSLCLTLPSMAAISTMWPVVGGACAVMMTVATYFMQGYLNQTRDSLYQPKPEALTDMMARQPSHGAL